MHYTIEIVEHYSVDVEADNDDAAIDAAYEQVSMHTFDYNEAFIVDKTVEF